MSSPQCCENPPTLNSSSGTGSVEEVEGIKCYVTGSSDSKLAIILVSDIFGYEAPNLRKLADKIAAAGFYVMVPDLLYADPFVPENSERPVKVWIQAHNPVKGAEDVKPIVSALKSKGLSVGAAGFCWGAKVVVELAKSDDLKAIVMLHPSRVTIDDVKELKIPFAILGAEIDQVSPPELLKQCGEAAKPEVDHFVKIFPGTSHGWSVRYKVEDEAAVKLAEEAHQDMLDWLTKYVK